MDEWCTPFDIDDLIFPTLMDVTLKGSEFCSDSGLKFDFDTILAAAPEACGQNKLEALEIQLPIHVPDLEKDLKSVRIDQLETKVQYLETRIRTFDNYITQLIPWTVRVAAELERLADCQELVLRGYERGGQGTRRRWGQRDGTWT
ncbi:hypothetical protein Q9L58_010646 [Maublancomyces gigas]|uniref:Uncharacterized protein n=1 Tax=Discina gigas TaxID=1032678 RepID=A0ABR3G4H8_9PEZI